MGKRAKNAEITTSQGPRGASATTTIGTGTLRVTIPGTDELAAQALLVDMLKLGGSTLRKPRIKAPSPVAMERRGQSYLESEAGEPSTAAVWRVRIWYRNAANELVACDSDLMTRQAAESLESDMRANHCDAHDAKAWSTKPTIAHGAAVPPVTGARIVVLPHALGSAEPSDAVAEVAPPVEVATVVIAPIAASMAKRPTFKVGSYVTSDYLVTGAPFNLCSDVVCRVVESDKRSGRARLERADGREGSWWVNLDAISKSEAPNPGSTPYYAGSPTGRPADVVAPVPAPIAVVRPRLAGAGAYSLRRAA